MKLPPPAGKIYWDEFVEWDIKVNKMKAYTDIEQSKKLAEILAIESADMWWNFYSVTTDSTTPQIIHLDTPWVGNFNWDNKSDNVPCWSLAALLGVLPTTIGDFFEKNALRLRMDKGENDFNIWYENFDCGDVAEGLDVREDNPVDACYELILKLHEQKIL